MATWTLVREPDGRKTLMFEDRDCRASAGTCSAATPDRLIVQWFVEQGDAGDVIVTAEGTFALPLRSPTPSEVAC